MSHLSETIAALLVCAFTTLLVWLSRTLRIRGVAQKSRRLLRVALALCFLFGVALLLVLKAPLFPIGPLTFGAIVFGIIVCAIQSYRILGTLEAGPLEPPMEGPS